MRFGLPLEDIVEKINGVIKEMFQSEEITLMAEDISGLVRNRYITRLDDLQFDGFRWVAKYKSRKVDLSPNSAILMSFFVSKPGISVTYQEIVDRVYPRKEVVGKPSIMCKTITHRPRDDLLDLPGREEWIENGERGGVCVCGGGEKYF